MMNSKKLAATIVCAAAAALAAGTAFAQAAAPAAGAKSPVQSQGPDEVFKRWDKDGNKSLSLDEFKAGFDEVEKANLIRKMHQNFVAMDTNKSNAIEANEFGNLELIKKAGAKAPMMSAFDTDKNGKLDFKEYVGMVGTMMRNK